MVSKFDTVKRIVALEELVRLPAGTEMLMLHNGGSGRQHITLHGYFDRVSLPFVNLTKYVELPIHLTVDEYDPAEVLTFLRDLQDSRYARQEKVMGFNLRGSLDLPTVPQPFWNIYQVV